MEKQNSMKINQLPSKTWYWLGLNDTKVKWAAGAPCEICAEELSADDEITGFPEAMNTGAGKETDVLFAPEQTKNWSVSAKEGQTKQVTLSIGQGKEKVSSGKIRAAAEEGASLTVFEVFEPAQAAGQLAVRTELYAKKDSRIRLVQVMMRGEGQELLNDVGCICEKNGALDLLQVVVGKGDVYDGIWTELQKDHASLQAEIGYLLQNQQKFDVNLNVRHFGKVTESTIQADGTLMDAAEKIFRGTIDFVRGSADSVGAETEQVLLLGDDVVNKTIPVILCAEENVQGSHGAAIGELDEETLFYFGARGMDRTQAENTMARAKLEAKIQKIGDADIEQKNANPLRGFYPLSLEATESYQEARKTVQKFIHAEEPEEIIFTRNTTESLNLVAYSYGLNFLKEGDEIAVTIMEHHSNLLPWQMVSRMTGAKLHYLECTSEGELTDEALQKGINERTRLVAVAQVSNVLGCVNPLQKITEMAHRVGAVVVVDGAQSVPHMPVDVQALDADFLAFSGHKLMGPMGIGCLYGKRELLEKMPPFLTGGEMIDSVHRDGAVFAPVPQKFEAGTVNAAGAVGLAAAIRYLQEKGFDYIQKKELELTQRAMEGLGALPYVHILGSKDPANHTGIVSFTIDGVHPHDVSEILSSDGIDVRAGHHCAQPLLEYLGVRSSTRASMMFYNTPEEIDALIESVSTIRRRMGYGE